jgi:hypothetical protein
MEYQALMVVRALELALAKAQDLLQAVPLGQPQSEAQVQLLVQALVQVQRQALALEQVLGQEQEVPLLELGLPQEALQQLEEQVQQGWEQAAQRALAVAEAQVEVLAAEQVRELVQVPLLEAE